MYLAKWLQCAIGMLALCSACAPARSPREALDAIAEGYVRAALRLAQHKPDLVEAWRGPEAWRPGPREPVAAVRAEIARLRRASAEARSQELDEASRVRLAYLDGQLGALDFAAARLLGESTPFEEEIRRAFGLEALPPEPPSTAEARAALSSALPGDGSIVERHRAFRQRFAVPAARREAVLRAALEACRAETVAHLPLPPGETLELRLDVETGWDGLARYEGDGRSVVEISRAPLDVSRALTLACHEGYPGHHVQYLLIERAEVQERGWTEFLLAPRFGPHVLITEGGAEAGVDLAMPPERRRDLYAQTLLPLAGIPADAADALVEVEERVRALDGAIPGIVGAYLDSRVSRDDTVRALGEVGVLDPDAFVAFAERHRTLGIVYPVGRRVVLRAIARGDDPWARLGRLFTSSALTLN